MLLSGSVPTCLCLPTIYLSVYPNSPHVYLLAYLLIYLFRQSVWYTFIHSKYSLPLIYQALPSYIQNFSLFPITHLFTYLFKLSRQIPTCLFYLCLPRILPIALPSYLNFDIFAITARGCFIQARFRSQGTVGFIYIYKERQNIAVVSTKCKELAGVLSEKEKRKNIEKITELKKGCTKTHQRGR